MATKRILYTTHVDENEFLVADTIRRERPEIYLAESPEVLNPDYEAFCSDPNMPIEELRRRIKDNGYIMGTGRAAIATAVRDIGGRVIAVESTALGHRYLEQHAEAAARHYGSSSRLTRYHIAKRLKEQPDRPRTEIEQDALMLGPVIVRDLDGFIGRMERAMREAREVSEETIRLEIEREKYAARRIGELRGPSMLSYYHYAHRTLSHLLARDGIVLPYEFVGDIPLDPEQKFHLLRKYQILDIDPEELRHEDPHRDCDPSQIDTYYDLIALWSDHAELTRSMPLNQSTRAFWDNLDEIKRANEQSEQFVAAMWREMLDRASRSSDAPE